MSRVATVHLRLIPAPMSAACVLSAVECKGDNPSGSLQESLMAPGDTQYHPLCLADAPCIMSSHEQLAQAS